MTFTTSQLQTTSSSSVGVILPIGLAAPIIAITLVSGVGSQPVVRDSYVSTPNVRTVTDWYPDLVGAETRSDPSTIDELLDRYRGALEPGSFTPADIDALRNEWA